MSLALTRGLDEWGHNELDEMTIGKNGSSCLWPGNFALCINAGLRAA